MSRLRSWRKLAQRLGFILILSAFLGVISEQLTLTLLIAVSGCLVWQLWALYRLERWVRDNKSLEPPPIGPVWEEIAARIGALRRQNRKRKRKFSRMLERFQQATAALPDAAVILDENDHVVWCNSASQGLLGLVQGRDSGLPVANLLRNPTFVSFLVQRRPAESVDFPSPLDSGQTLNARIVPYGKKQRLLLVADISRVRRLEQMRREFIANVSHELRTPLTVVIGYLETLLDSDSPALEPWRQPLRGMRQQAGRMLHIIEDLLMLARLETQRDRTPGKPVAVPRLLADIADDAVALSGEQNHRIDLTAEPDLWLLGCEKELRSAFSNLVFNAVRYTPAGGIIEIHWFADATGLHLVVTDNGEGIAPQHIPRLTERFYRVDRDRSRGSGGTGLGLSIVKHVLTNHGGHLHIISELGKGSRFACAFPRELRAGPSAALPVIGPAPNALVETP